MGGHLQVRLSPELVTSQVSPVQHGLPGPQTLPRRMQVGPVESGQADTPDRVNDAEMSAAIRKRRITVYLQFTEGAP